MNNIPEPQLDDLLHALGEAGRRLAEGGASEGAAGNLSVCLRHPPDVRAHFPLVEAFALPLPVPRLAGAAVIVSGSGRRLREMHADPPAHLACLVIGADGRTAALHTSPRRRFARPTSELNSHLAVHHAPAGADRCDFLALAHAQPVRLTYLSHIPRYQDERFLNERLLRWQPETIMNLPEGIGVIPFHTPGSAELMAATAAALQRARLVVWSRHGVMARSSVSMACAVDLVEYAETAAHYELLNLSAGEPADGLSRTELLDICRAYGVQPSVF